MLKHHISIQTIVFSHKFFEIERWCDSINNAVRVLKKSYPTINASVTMGDCSPLACLDENEVERIRKLANHLESFHYSFFDSNLGSAAGHNRLASENVSEYIMTVNPDTVMAPTCLTELFSLMEDPDTGIAEAIQMPLEHPKEFDLQTGDTSWASTCCALIRRRAFIDVNGFDSSHFFLHCDDVDFSWMVRRIGYRVRVAPRAIIFHHHGFGEDNAYIATDAEIRFSAIGSLMLFAKWGRRDLLDSSLAHFHEHPDIYDVVLRDWETHENNNTIPDVIDNADSVAQFIEGAFALHRW